MSGRDVGEHSHPRLADNLLHIGPATRLAREEPQPEDHGRAQARSKHTFFTTAGLTKR